MLLTRSALARLLPDASRESISRLLLLESGVADAFHGALDDIPGL
jgi:hypothetical protein